ncbi:metallophosphoesterase [Kovacikia minuta CCNUW1]|uniref:metallophosphoesterase family protein n=1 Tax=Kovacikia minuta TaxID=2931930 RepID=UPI001CCF5B0C|nr:metallophosphoesterase [Kovacikia minuta]UBF25329.1 metallophosphoesterase [Kovacikia minuta CCNUW1]
MAPQAKLLTDPFLQLPNKDSVRVVWFTEFAGSRHTVVYGFNLEQTAVATTTRLSRTREDGESKLATPSPNLTVRPIWRHEAEVTGLPAERRIPYQVVSTHESGEVVRSQTFTLAATPPSGKPLKILLTSDHQLKPLVAANLQKVVETIGQVDAVLFAGDLVDIPDRASDWFDSTNGNAFFPTLQGRAHYDLKRENQVTRYRGGALIQSAPLFPAIGNHEVMGRFSSDRNLGDQFDHSVPRSVAERAYAKNSEAINPTNDPAIRAAWIKNNSFNTDTYEEIFTLPESSPAGKQYYAITFGDVRLIVLYATNMWRTPSLAASARGKYQERQQDLNNPGEWGYGQHIFGEIAQGTPQYNWLQQELDRPEFKQAKYKIVMFHHPPHSLGFNVVPAYTDPVQVVERNLEGAVTAVRYEYPKQADYLVRDVVPLLEAAGVQLVFYGHSHLWNRFLSSSGMHFLETSNVGNSYDAYVGDRARPVPAANTADYAPLGNPNGLLPIVPSIAPLLDSSGDPLPYIASNDITVFSILYTDTGTLSSYYFDTRKPESTVIQFDEFKLQ